MIDSFGISGLGGSSGLLAGGSTSSQGPAGNPFGADFLLGVFAQRALANGSAYDAQGQPIGISDKSPTAQRRKTTLAEIQKFLKANDSAQARAAAEDLLRRDPNDAEAAAYVGRTHLIDGAYSKAERYFAKAARGSSNQQIQLDLRAAQTLKRGEPAAVDQARKLLKQEATAREGLQLVTHVLDRNPGNAEARVAIATYYERTGKLNLASAELTDGVGATPAEKIAPLVEYLEGFAARHADAAGAHDLLAQARAIAGDLSGAESSFARALELAGDDAALRSALKEDFAEIYARQGRAKQVTGNVADARRLFHRALDLVHNDEHRTDLSDLEYAAASTAIRTGRLNEALKALDEARAYKPSAPKTGDDKRQEDLIEAYERIEARFTAAGDLKGIVGARNGAYQLDTKDADRKRSLADAHDAYGLALLDDGEYRLAYRQFKAASELFKDDTSYKAHRDEAWNGFH